MPDLPTGIVTFLFTDIEGSTKLNQNYDAVMTGVLARHDQLIEACVVSHEGVLVRPRGEGDSRFVVFRRATDAVSAAYQIQKTLGQEPWPNGVAVRVRMALHTGEADVINGDYRGTAVDRCARLRSVGHGEQVLLSQTTYELVRDILPQNISLLDLGLHRLKDLQRPEQVFQLLHPDLLRDFPPLKSLGAFPHNLPIQPTSFIGRGPELAELKLRLDTTQLLTLTGTGGTGKTRLSLQVAVEVLEAYGDGVWLVELATLTEPGLVPQAVATVLGVKEEANRTIAQTLTDYLKTRTLLLVLDNCEHLVLAVSQFVSELLRSCPHIKILATSREALGIGGEVAWHVPTLAIPDGRNVPVLEGLLQYEAVRLFIERATGVKQDFAVNNQNAPAVAQLCYRLDGIPLAIELAAARVKVLAVEQILGRLDQRFRLLTGGGRTVLPRQQTLLAAIAWSYDLLAPLEQRIFQRLSVFVGGWTLDAAELVCADAEIEAFEVLDLLARLVDTSLVEVEPGADGSEVRYRFLESIRQYSGEQLLGADFKDAVQERHLDWCLALAEEAETELQGASQVECLARLEVEHDNVRAALGRFTQADAPIDAVEKVLRLVGAFRRFWQIRNYYREGRQFLQGALVVARSSETLRERAKALHGLGILAYGQSDYEVAKSSFEESLAIRRELQDFKEIVQLLNSLGAILGDLGDYATAKALHEEGLEIAQGQQDEVGIADTFNNLGGVALQRGDLAEAKARLEACLQVRRRLGEPMGLAEVLNNLGALAVQAEEFEAASGYLAESLGFERLLGNTHGVAESLGNLGVLALYQQDYETAQTRFKEGLTIQEELGDRAGVAVALNNLGMVAKERQDFSAAKGLFERSLEIRRGLGLQLEVAEVLCELGAVAQSMGDGGQAKLRYEESLALFEALGVQQGRQDCVAGLAQLEAVEGDDV